MNTAEIRTALADAYNRLGITGTEELEAYILQALDYLERDRERYIEAVEPDFSGHRITERFGVICKLIPLAQEIDRNQEKNYIWENTTIFSLMVAGDTLRYVYTESYAWLHDNPKENTYSNPIHRYAGLEDIQKTLRPCPPDEIRKAATKREWEIYAMVFTAYGRFCGEQPINSIPQKTERTMLAYAHVIPETLTVDGRNVTGKLLPLAEGFPRDELWRDHRHTRKDELCLLVTEDTQQYLLKSCHLYHYFRKDFFDDVPGGCGYMPTGNKTEITYSITRLEDIRQVMFPLCR